jgi:hypothetical protein
MKRGHGRFFVNFHFTIIIMKSFLNLIQRRYLTYERNGNQFFTDVPHKVAAKIILMKTEIRLDDKSLIHVLQHL